jgi:hypothetical protein
MDLKKAAVFADGEKAGAVEIAKPSGVRISGTAVVLDSLTAAVVCTTE